MQLPIAEPELLRLEEQGIIQERKGVEDVEAELPTTISANPLRSPSPHENRNR